MSPSSSPPSSPPPSPPSSPPSSRVLAQRDEDGILTLSLHRPERRNALDLPMLEALDHGLTRAEEPETRLVVLRGAGPGFCSGVDVAALASVVAGHRHASLRQLVAGMQALPNRMVALEKPVIAVLHSWALGMGLELALGADIRLATARTRLALPETRLGLVADVAGTTRLARLVGLSRAKQMHLFGREIRAEEALKWGLVDAVVPPEDLEATVTSWCRQALDVAPLAAGLAKRIIERAVTEPPDHCLEMERLAQSTVVDSEDLAEGMQAWMQKRRPRFRGR